ncbi:right-handed parallel beta-helix repeat-containing protein [Myxococcus sp. AM010]|uniref:right-handed parallel beta-helix repeat-containing protein n=2 Tax=unclassified Myxococcus TaxID=2648731 RepID=UPI00159557C8|nr:right-handed parallel beta-helix repeat-containing protein [Myxococcus sp. AM010]NVJ19035.1 right-handed parallel beta-helix repeat-containing protein [Myxococcus sp. AM010]
MKAFRRSRSLFALPVVLVLAACSSGPEDRPAPGDDAGVTDGGADAGTPDSGTDAGVTDSGTDAGTPDAGPDIEVPEDGGTIVRGTLTGRLTVGGSPYRVVGDANGVVTIPQGQVLTVGPGVILDFRGQPEVTERDVDSDAPDNVMNHQAGRVEVRVYGAIQVQGTAEAPVLLTSTNPHGWWGMNFYGASSVGSGDPVFEHMIFEKVRKNQYNSDRDWTRGALWVYYPGPVTITDSVFRDNESSANCGALDLMFTDGSRVENTVFENNRIREIDRFAQPGTSSMAGGGAVCITHGRNTVLRGNTFRGNFVEAFGGSLTSDLWDRPILTWPNPGGIFDLGGGAAIHYFQPDNDLLEGNVFESNFIPLGPGAAVQLEDMGGSRTVIMRGNRFVNNRGGAGGVITCNRGSNTGELVITRDNVFTGNTVNGQPATNMTGDCGVVTQ